MEMDEVSIRFCGPVNAAFVKIATLNTTT